MKRDALEYIVEGCEQVVVFDKLMDNMTYTSKPVHEVEIPIQSNIQTHTLQGLLDYIDLEEFPKGSFIHVYDPSSVTIKSPVRDGDKKRILFAEAIYSDRFRTPGFIPAEEFVIFIQSKFIQDENTSKVLEIVSNMKSGSSVKIGDNGISQMVEVKTGAVSLAEVNIPNPIRLHPMRTFPEVSQPAQDFVLRIKQDRDGLPSVGLIEGDAGAWEIEAINNIKNWLKVLTQIPVIG